jgi:hypothetical protein
MFFSKKMKVVEENARVSSLEMRAINKMNRHLLSVSKIKQVRWAANKNVEQPTKINRKIQNVVRCIRMGLSITFQCPKCISKNHVNVLIDKAWLGHSDY